MPPARFLTDTSLDYLARRLRFLGYDVVTHQGARLDELYELARRDGRTVLTLSRKHPVRFADVAAIPVPREDMRAAVRLIAGGHDPASEPFSRCPACNLPLHKRHPFEARGEVPGRVLRAAKSLHYCPGCGKWYWRGSHVDRVLAWLSAAVGREIQWPHDRDTAADHDAPGS